MATPFVLGGSRKARANAGQPAKTRNILMPIGDATEAVDTLYPFFRLQEEGFKVTVCGPEARIYHMVTHEVPPNAVIRWDITQEAPGYHITAEKAFRDIRPEEYDGIFVSGGRAPEYLRYDKDLLRITRHFFETNKPVSVVCHGVEILAAAGVIKNRKLTTVAKCELDITQVGGVYVADPMVVDGNLISCRTWHDFNTPYMKLFVEQVLKLKS
ncbi:DJ-1/PfpI/YhbO family deglycase/protease [Dyadobacter pollutisoli]|uniref:DJ-1/PfpI/YhbO family deglycase/protease n=1 Tax=Dyadobacter pollutisoli TaxID=2910158 RepID=A0A9E8SS49_9BACT|nr:DJ-1/PfpI/YhbO family deglycase/protease [Dyadobacter pollutisoli]WAC14942.1 DJ-1/PfpI/YhbO family deglycase/protease [Dyadobacter pollutisoli]